jgi:hypothetical protein
MANTTLAQLCTTLQTSTGSTVFSIASSITVPGDLPQTEIFVFQITSPTNPKADTFLRVATIYDLTTVTIGRGSAVLAGTTLYLDSGFTVTFTDVQTATTAKQLIQARVDSLVTDWDTYETAFIVPPSVQIPLTSPSLITAAKNTYYAAVATAATASTTAAMATATLTADNATLSTANATLSSDQVLYAQCQSIGTALAAISTGEIAFVSASNALLTASVAFAAANPSGTGIATINAANTAYASAVNAELTALRAPLTTLIASQSAYCAGLAAKVNPSSGSDVFAVAFATAAVNAATAANHTAQASLTAANAAVTTALAAVQALCPSFTG